MLCTSTLITARERWYMQWMFVRVLLLLFIVAVDGVAVQLDTRINDNIVQVSLLVCAFTKRTPNPSIRPSATNINQ